MRETYQENRKLSPFFLLLQSLLDSPAAEEATEEVERDTHELRTLSDSVDEVNTRIKGWLSDSRCFVLIAILARC